MRRSGRLRRKAELARGEELKRSAPLKAGKPLKRGTGPKSKPKAAAGSVERAARAAWHDATIQRAMQKRGKAHVIVCPVCNWKRVESYMEAHHVIEKAKIKGYVSGLMLPEREAQDLLLSLLYDKRNGLPVCRFCHESHTKRVEGKTIPLRCIDAKHRQFAAEIGLAWYIDKVYGAAA